MRSFLTSISIDTAQALSVAFSRYVGADIVQESPAALFSFTGLPFHLANRIFISDTHTEEELLCIKQKAELQSVSYSWIVQHLHVPAIAPFLEKHAFKATTMMTSMSFDLSQTFHYGSKNIYESHVLEPIIALWQDCFSFPEEVARTYLVRLSKSALRPYYADIQGQFAGSGWLLVEEEQAGLFFIATHPAMRNRGVATEMVQALLYKAKERGCKTAYLVALPQAKRLYERLGFVQMSEYVLFEPEIYKLC